MTWSEFLWSPRGRLNRSRYWGAVFLQYGVGVSLWLPFIVLEKSHVMDAHPVVAAIYAIFAVIGTIAFIVSHAFAQIKRFHDRDKSWPWVFIQFVPYIGAVWVLVELGLLPGTEGHNRYGADPLGRAGDIVDVFDGPSLTDQPPLIADPTLRLLPK